MIPQDGADDEGRCIVNPVAKADEGGEKRSDCIKAREAGRIRTGGEGGLEEKGKKTQMMRIRWDTFNKMRELGAAGPSWDFVEIGRAHV